MARVLMAMIMLATALTPQAAGGADMSISKDDVGQLWLQVVGLIENGDAAKFRTILVDAIGRQQQIINVSVYSPGGLAIPAMKIGRYVRMLHLTTVAPEELPLIRLRVCKIYTNGKADVIDYNPLTRRGDPQCVCAGECFLVWAAGTARIWSGVELRRVSLADGEPRDIAAGGSDARAGTTVLDYLREMGIPESTIGRISAMADDASGRLTVEERNLLETKTGLPRMDEPFRSRCRDRVPTSPAALACEKAVSRELYWTGARLLLEQSE